MVQILRPVHLRKVQGTFILRQSGLLWLESNKEVENDRRYSAGYHFSYRTILFETIKEHSYIIVIGVEYEHGT